MPGVRNFRIHSIRALEQLLIQQRKALQHLCKGQSLERLKSPALHARTFMCISHIPSGNPIHSTDLVCREPAGLPRLLLASWAGLGVNPTSAGEQLLPFSTRVSPGWRRKAELSPRDGNNPTLMFVKFLELCSCRCNSLLNALVLQPFSCKLSSHFWLPVLFPLPLVVSCAVQRWHWPPSEELPAADSAHVAGSENVTQSMCLLPDAAFLAREKARADAECYTAMKVAEANKVLCFPLWWLRAGPLAPGCRETPAQVQAVILV